MDATRMSAHAIARAADTAALLGLRPERPGRQLAALLSDGTKGGRIWLATSAVAAASPRLRPAARDGLCAWAASAGAAFAAKAVTDRRRPGLAGVGAPPRSSSMPSSHTAGAFAYAVAAGTRSRSMGAVLLPIAGAVAWSRTATSRHFPTDVAAGVALGILVGLGTHAVTSAARSRSPEGDEGAACHPGRPAAEVKMAVAAPAEAPAELAAPLG